MKLTELNGSGPPEKKGRKEKTDSCWSPGKAGRTGPLLVYLASDASGFINGTTIFMDGGMVIG